MAVWAVGLHVVRWFQKVAAGLIDTQPSDVDEMALTDPS